MTKRENKGSARIISTTNEHLIYVIKNNISNNYKYCKNNNFMKTLNVRILRMTGEVTDRFNEITLFRIALFWKKQLNTLQNL